MIGNRIANGIDHHAWVITRSSIPNGFSALTPWETIFDPTHVYLRYSTVIDFFVFALVFIGIAHFSLRKKFPGRAGRAVSLGIGLALAFSMISVEKKYHFTLSSFGTVAIVLLTFLFGIMVYHSFLYLKMNPILSFLLTLIVTMLVVTTIDPNLYDLSSTINPFLYPFLVIVFLVFLLKALAKMSVRNPDKTLKVKLRKLSQNHFNRIPNEELATEANSLKKLGIPGIKKMLSNMKETKASFDELDSAIQHYGANPRARSLLAQKIQMTFQSNRYLKKSLDSLKTLNERLLALDSSLFSAKQRQLMEKMSLKERRKLKKEILDEQQKVGLESEIEELETRIENREIAINQSLRDSMRNLLTGRIEEALKKIRIARVWKKEGYLIAQRIQDLEKKILRISLLDIDQTKI